MSTPELVTVKIDERAVQVPKGTGIVQTALHKHLLEQNPPVWWTHIHGMGDATQLAQGLRAALDATSISPPATPPAAQRRPAASVLHPEVGLAL